MNRRRLPIGIQTLRGIRDDDCYYVDKTPLVRDLVSQGRYYFLSRPRRFGKSLLLDTLHELFAGSERLFRGLLIHEYWDWAKAHPVVRLSFDGKYNEPGDLPGNVAAQLHLVEREAGVHADRQGLAGPDRLGILLSRLHAETGRQVVVLVDEYDKPILDALDTPELAKANRDYLRGLYGTIKGSARHVRFALACSPRRACSRASTTWRTSA